MFQHLKLIPYNQGKTKILFKLPEKHETKINIPFKFRVKNIATLGMPSMGPDSLFWGTHLYCLFKTFSH